MSQLGAGGRGDDGGRKRRDFRRLPSMAPGTFLVGGRFEVCNEIGRGTHSNVYQALDLGDRRRPVAVKVERLQGERPLLRNEADVLDELAGCPGVPKKVGFWAESSTCSVLAMELLGSDLSVTIQCVGKLSPAATATLGIQMLASLQAVHDRGLLHRDVKLGNFALGLKPEDASKVYLLDYGLVRRHLQANGKARPARPRTPFRGTTHFASVAAQCGEDTGRVDDLWSLAFSLMLMCTGRLPWDNIYRSGMHGEKKAKAKAMVLEEKKRLLLAAMHSNPCSNSSLRATGEYLESAPEEFVEFLRDLQCLRYGSRPDYNRLRRLLREVLGGPDNPQRSQAEDELRQAHATVTTEMRSEMPQRLELTSSPLSPPPALAGAEASRQPGATPSPPVSAMHLAQAKWATPRAPPVGTSASANTAQVCPITPCVHSGGILTSATTPGHTQLHRVGLVGLTKAPPAIGLTCKAAPQQMRAPIQSPRTPLSEPSSPTLATPTPPPAALEAQPPRPQWSPPQHQPLTFAVVHRPTWLWRTPLASSATLRPPPPPQKQESPHFASQPWQALHTPPKRPPPVALAPACSMPDRLVMDEVAAPVPVNPMAVGAADDISLDASVSPPEQPLPTITPGAAPAPLAGDHPRHPPLIQFSATQMQASVPLVSEAATAAGAMDRAAASVGDAQGLHPTPSTSSAPALQHPAMTGGIRSTPSPMAIDANAQIAADDQAGAVLDAPGIAHEENSGGTLVAAAWAPKLGCDPEAPLPTPQRAMTQPLQTALPAPQPKAAPHERSPERRLLEAPQSFQQEECRAAEPQQMLQTQP